MNINNTAIEALDYQLHGHFCLNLKTGEVEFERYDPKTFKMVKINLQEYIEEYKQESRLTNE